MSTKHILSEDPLFICYATVLGEWYKSSDNVTNLSNAVHAWVMDFCSAHEIDPNSDFVKVAEHSLKLTFWNAMLADISILPDTTSFAVIEAGMSVDIKKFTPGIGTKPKKP